MTQPNVATQAAAQQEQQPAPRPTRKKQPTVMDVATEFVDWVTAFQRSLSGWNALQLSYLSYVNQLPEGERKKGLPILTFKAPAPNGREAIEVVADLKKVDPQYVPHVMVPLINAQQGDMVEALEEIAIRVDDLRKMLGISQAQPQTQQQQADDIPEAA